MTRKIKLLGTVFSAAIFAAAQAAQADSLIVGLSPHGTQDAKKHEIIHALKHVTQITDIGEQSVFINALTGQSICPFIVPDKPSYRGDKAKLNANKACAGKLMAFARDADSTERAGAIDFWGTLRSVVTDYDMNAVDAIVLIGDPRFHNVDDLRFSMLEGHAPNDDHTKAELTESVYGMAGLEGALNGTAVHVSSEGYTWFENARHREAVTRLQSLTVSYLGGNLVTANQDTAQMFARVREGRQEGVKSYQPIYSDKLEIVFVGQAPQHVTPIYERDVTTDYLPGGVQLIARDVEVGISWNCACDIDLYARAHEDADILYYGHQSSREGRFWKDYRSAEDLLNGLETIQFAAPVDLNDLVIGINFYSGQSHNESGGESDSASGGAHVTGEIRLSIGHQTYARPFEIIATSGNRGRGRETAIETGAAPSSHWVVMSGADIVTAN